MEIFYCGSRPGKEVAEMLREAFALLPRSGSTAILPMLHLFARETALSCLLLLPVYPALRAIRRIFPD